MTSFRSCRVSSRRLESFCKYVASYLWGMRRMIRTASLNCFHTLPCWSTLSIASLLPVTLPVTLPVMLPVTLPVTLPITLSHTLTLECVGVLPAPQDVYPGERIPLFGLLFRLAKSHDECHFCLDSIVENQIFTMETPCADTQVIAVVFKNG